MENRCNFCANFSSSEDFYYRISGRNIYRKGAVRVIMPHRITIKFPNYLIHTQICDRTREFSCVWHLSWYSKELATSRLFQASCD